MNVELQILCDLHLQNKMNDKKKPSPKQIEIIFALFFSKISRFYSVKAMFES